MIDLPSAEYSECFICDEVRKEASGKLIAIGVYVSNIMVRSVPIDLGLALVFRMKAKRTGTVTFRIRGLLDGVQVAELHGGSKVVRPIAEVTHTPRFGVSVEKFGLLEFQISETGDDWHAFGSLPIEQYEEGRVTSSSA